MAAGIKTATPSAAAMSNWHAGPGVQSFSRYGDTLRPEGIAGRSGEFVLESGYPGTVEQFVPGDLGCEFGAFEDGSDAAGRAWSCRSGCRGSLQLLDCLAEATMNG